MKKNLRKLKSTTQPTYEVVKNKAPVYTEEQKKEIQKALDEIAAKSNAEKESITEELNLAEAEINRPKNYLYEKYMETKMVERTRMSSGIPCLDKMMGGGLKKTLYVLAAPTSGGKSAVALQMAFNLAMQGIHVLYFTLEMPWTDLYDRGVAYLSHMHRLAEGTPDIPFGDLDVDSFRYDPELKEYVYIPFSQYDELAKEFNDACAEHLHIIESELDKMCATQIKKKALAYTNTFGAAVVIVDYLQVLGPTPEHKEETDERIKINASINTFYNLTKKINMPVILISSINRASYGKSVSTGAFSGSGRIEYSAGVAISIDWDGVTNAKSSEAEENEKNICIKRGYRKLKISLLKNRKGVQDNLMVQYYPAVNYICGAGEPGYTEENGQIVGAKNGFSPLANGEKTPFDKESEDNYHQETLPGVGKRGENLAEW